MKHLSESVKYHKAKGWNKSFEVVKRYDREIRDEMYEIVIVRSKAGMYSGWCESGKIQRYILNSKSSFPSLEECEAFIDDTINFREENRRNRK